MTSILGISAFYHDSAAALIVDGKIISAAQEERFSRKKHDASYPSKAINFILEENNLKLNEIDHIVFFEKPFLIFERLLETYLAFAPRGCKSFRLSMPLGVREKLGQKNFYLINLNNMIRILIILIKLSFLNIIIATLPVLFFHHLLKKLLY